MKTGEPEQAPTTDRLVLERFVAGGEAMGRSADGRVVFVRGGLPGESVEVEYVEERAAWARAVARTVHESSSHRVVPPCPRRLAGCGGCDWQHVAVGAQIGAKASIVTDALRRTARVAEPHVVSGPSVVSIGYRSTIRVVGGADGRAGFRAERSHEVVAATGCLVAHPALVDLIERIEISPGLDVVLRTSVATGARMARWDPSGGVVGGIPDDVLTDPDASIEEVVAGHRLRVSAESFFQSGPAAAELLVAAVRRAAPELDGASHVLDAYGGVGLFSVAAVPASARVTVVESSAAATRDAEVNLAGRDAVVVRADMGRWRATPGDLPVDVVIADPARAGLGRDGVHAVAATGAATVVLVSCDPAAGARDVALLVDAGYRLDSTEVLDLFPHTHHVEMVSRLVRVGDGRGGHDIAGGPG